MTESIGQTAQIQQWLDRLANGQTAAREELLRCAADRLTHLTCKILRDFPEVKRWEETSDVFQNAAIRLHRALAEVQVADARHFYRLAAMQIRRELIDLSRHYRGPHGLGANYESVARADDDPSRLAAPLDPGVSTLDPRQIQEWQEFHEAVAALPDDPREVFDLLWYHELSQKEAAELLGVDERTVRRRWREARLTLHQSFSGELPGI